MAAITDFENKSKHFSYYDDHKEKHESIEAVYSFVSNWEQVKFSAFGATYKEATEKLKKLIQSFVDDMTDALQD